MLGERIRQIVDSQWKGTKKELADRIGISAGNLYELYKRDSVETKYLFAIAEALGVSVSVFFDESEFKAIPKDVESHRNVKSSKEVENLKDRYIEKLEGEVTFLREMIQMYGLGKWLRNMQATGSDSWWNPTVTPGMLSAQPK